MRGLLVLGFSLMIFGLWGLFTGPAPYSDVFNVTQYQLDVDGSFYEHITNDKVISLVEVSDVLCALSRQNEAIEVNAFICNVSDYWIGPRSINFIL